LSLNQLRNLRKSNERKRDHQFIEKKTQSNIFFGSLSMKTCNLPAAYSLESLDYATSKGSQNPIKSSIPFIVDRRPNSDKEIIEHNVKVSTEGQPKCVTSSLFENLESLCSIPRPTISFVPQPNYPIILEKNDEIMNNATNAQSRKEDEILDDVDYLRDFQQLQESIQMEDFEQLSPHSGFESVTFDKNENFLDFLDPAEFEPDCQVTSWTNYMPGTKKSQNGRRAHLQDRCGEYNSMVYQVETIKRKAEDCLEKSNNESVDENNKVIEMKTYADVFLQEQFEYNSWQNP
jgi:hypothetical protein